MIKMIINIAANSMDGQNGLIMFSTYNIASS